MSRWYEKIFATKRVFVIKVSGDARDVASTHGLHAYFLAGDPYDPRCPSETSIEVEAKDAQDAARYARDVLGLRVFHVYDPRS